jgi:hypothetical protein
VSDPNLSVWTIEVVDDAQITFLINGEVIMLHTSDQATVYLDDLFAQRAPGKPVELKKEHALQLARLILHTLGEDE